MEEEKCGVTFSIVLMGEIKEIGFSSLPQSVVRFAGQSIETTCQIKLILREWVSIY